MYFAEIILNMGNAVSTIEMERMLLLLPVYMPLLCTDRDRVLKEVSIPSFPDAVCSVWFIAYNLLGLICSEP